MIYSIMHLHIIIGHIYTLYSYAKATQCHLLWKYTTAIKYMIKQYQQYKTKYKAILNKTDIRK